MDATILVPLDGSPHAERIIPFAEALARALGAGLHLLCVLDPSRLAGDSAVLASEGAARTYLERWEAQLGRRGVAVSVAVGRGDVATAIAAEAARRPLAAVALASHGRELLGRGAGGSVVAELLTRVAVPILVVRDWHAAATCRHLAAGASIVVPLDGSPHAEAALPFARGLATALSGELLLVRVVPPMPTWPAPAPTGSADTTRPIAAEQAAARAYLDATSARLGAGALPTRLGTGVGEVAAALAALAGRDERTLLVMATHGQTGDAQIPLGSVAREVFWRCEAPLILVPPPAAPPAPAPQERVTPALLEGGAAASPAP